MTDTTDHEALSAETVLFQSQAVVDQALRQHRPSLRALMSAIALGLIGVGFGMLGLRREVRAPTRRVPIQ